MVDLDFIHQDFQRRLREIPAQGMGLSVDVYTPDLFELVEYASAMMTLYPGDLISTGSPAGVGTARATPVYFKAGDRSTCTIQSIGTLRNTVQAEP